MLQAVTNILPDHWTFVGRSVELAELHRLVSAGGVYVTITGAAGVGKTCLVKRYASLHAQELSGGVWFVDLGAARTPIDVLVELTRVFGVHLALPESGADPASSLHRSEAQLGRALAAHGPLLLVLDNFEQLVPEAASHLESYLGWAPDARLLVTSRRRLRTPREVVLPLSPLMVPEVGAAPEEVFGFDAAKLFVHRARAAGREITPTDGDVGALGALLRRLDGLPLAIELCATRTPLLSLSQILDMLSERFELLGPPSSCWGRNATLRSAIDWSWELLAPWEQDALAQCSIFCGGFDIDALVAVLDLTPHEGAAPHGALGPLEVLQLLHDKSLVYAFSPRELPRARRYDLLESIRTYAAERLVERGAARDAELRHARYFTLAGTRWREQVDSPGGASALQRLILETDNILQARCAAASPEDALRALLALEPVFCARGPLGRFIELLSQTLGAPCADPALEARARGALGVAIWRSGRSAESAVELERAAALARATGAPALVAAAEARLGLAFGLLFHGDQAQSRAAFARARAASACSAQAGAELDYLEAEFLALIGRNQESKAYLERALAVHRRLGHELSEALMLAAIGGRCIELGELSEARPHLEAARGIYERYASIHDLTYVLFCLGTIALERGEHERARPAFTEALSSSRRVGVPLREANVLLWLGHLELEQLHVQAARERYAEALALFGPLKTRGLGAALAARAAAAAMLGELEEASFGFAQAEAELARASHPADLLMLALLRDHVELALADAAEKSGEVSTAEARRDAVRARIDAALAGDAPQSDDTRFAVRTLCASLSARGRVSSGEATGWTFDAGGRWFQAPGHEPVSLLPHPVLSRILQALVGARLGARGRAVTPATLIGAGWPGQKISLNAALNRLRVALHTLRRLGLRRLLQRRDDGYLLDPRVPIAIGCRSSDASSP